MLKALIGRIAVARCTLRRTGTGIWYLPSFFLRDLEVGRLTEYDSDTVYSSVVGQRNAS